MRKFLAFSLRVIGPLRGPARTASLWLTFLAVLPVIGSASVVWGQGELRVEIQEPVQGQALQHWESSFEVEGGASIFGGVRYLDLVFLIDTSKSLLKTDPRDYRAAGAIGLVQHLPVRSDIQIGVVDFDRNAEILQELTSDRGAVIAALRKLDRNGATDLAEGIERAVEVLDRGARPDSSRVVLIFTDGKSNEKKARAAMREARKQGVAIHTLLLGSDDDGESILREIATWTGGSFIHVTNPAKLPEAFLNLRTTGVERVELSINGSKPISTEFFGGRFRARVPLRIGENRLIARATSLSGETREHRVRFVASGPMTVAIDTPTEGAMLVDGESEAEVEGTVITFGEVERDYAASHPNRGVRNVMLRVGDGAPVPATLENGKFRGRLSLKEGENRIVATATGVDGRTTRDVVTLMVRPTGCAELDVVALRDGEPALSLSNRAIEIVFDASNSMWGRMEGRPKIEVAKEILTESLDWMPSDLNVALRVYGNRHPREQRNCADTELLVPLAGNDRGQIREAIAGFRPRGQTPLAHSLRQVAGDMQGFVGERAVVLVTDGLESCGGDPVEAARALQAGGSLPVHVIGFGLSTEGDEDPESLRAIAEVSGGRFLTARSAAELRDALSETVGTPYRVLKDSQVVAAGALGSVEPLRLASGEYRLELQSEPPHSVDIELESEQTLTLVLERDKDGLSRTSHSKPAAYAKCENPSASQPTALPAKRY